MTTAECYQTHGTNRNEEVIAAKTTNVYLAVRFDDNRNNAVLLSTTIMTVTYRVQHKSHPIAPLSYTFINITQIG